MPEQLSNILCSHRLNVVTTMTLRTTLVTLTVLASFVCSALQSAYDERCTDLCHLHCNASMNITTAGHGKGHFNHSDCMTTCLSEFNCSTVLMDDDVGIWWHGWPWQWPWQWFTIFLAGTSSTLLLVIVLSVVATCRSETQRLLLQCSVT